MADSNERKELSIYERSMLRLKKSEEKLKLIEQTMMASCTFHPTTNLSRTRATMGKPEDRKLRSTTSIKSRAPSGVGTRSVGTNLTGPPNLAHAKSWASASNKSKVSMPSGAMTPLASSLSFDTNCPSPPAIVHSKSWSLTPRKSKLPIPRGSMTPRTSPLSVDTSSTGVRSNTRHITPKKRIGKGNSGARTPRTSAMSVDTKSTGPLAGERRHSSSKSRLALPRQSNGKESVSRENTSRKSPVSVGGKSTSTGSSRIDKLYNHGVQKAKSRQARTDHEEQSVRRQRHENLRLRTCTFEPQMSWTAKTLWPETPKELAPPKAEPRTAMPASGAVPSISKPRGSQEAQLLQEEDAVASPPVRVIQTRKSPFVFDEDSASSLIVSPLRDPKMSIPRDVGPNSADGDSVTEYGSI